MLKFLRWFANNTSDVTVGSLVLLRPLSSMQYALQYGRTVPSAVIFSTSCHSYEINPFFQSLKAKSLTHFHNKTRNEESM